MGGFGSGSGQSGKRLTSDYRSLDVRRLQRDGLLQAGQAYNWQWSCNGEVKATVQIRVEAERIILSYRHRRPGQEWASLDYPIALERTPGTLGGERPWFLCPATTCGRRIAKLYLGKSGIFACRHCYDLAYPSQRKSPADRAIHRADRIHDRLDWEPGVLNGHDLKPNGMHWKTYAWLVRQHDAFASFGIGTYQARCAAARERLARTSKS